MSRFDYVKYDPVAQVNQNFAKTQFTLIEGFINRLNSPRASALAMTKLEECYMWIGKAIRDDQVARDGTYSLQEERKDG